MRARRPRSLMGTTRGGQTPSTNLSDSVKGSDPDRPLIPDTLRDRDWPEASVDC